MNLSSLFIKRPVTTTQRTTGQSCGPMASMADLKRPDAIVAYSPIVKNASGSHCPLAGSIWNQGIWKRTQPAPLSLQMSAVWDGLSAPLHDGALRNVARRERKGVPAAA